VALPKRIQENKRSSDRMIQALHHVWDRSLSASLRPLATRGVGCTTTRLAAPPPLNLKVPPPLIRLPRSVGACLFAVLCHRHRCLPSISALSSRVGPPLIAALPTSHPRLRRRGPHHHSLVPPDLTVPPPLIRLLRSVGACLFAALCHRRRCPPSISALSSRAGPR
jgi:hypothetical protein